MESPIKDLKKSEETPGNVLSLDQYENSLGQLGKCPYIYVLCTKTSGWGTKPFLLNDNGVRETFSMFKMGYEIFSNCARLSSALVPRNKNDRSLTSLKSLKQTGRQTATLGTRAKKIIKRKK